MLAVQIRGGLLVKKHTHKILIISASMRHICLLNKKSKEKQTSDSNPSQNAARNV